MQVTDHALLRYLERIEGKKLEKLRAELARKAAHARAAAESIGGGQYTIKIDGMKFRCRDNCLITVVTGDPERDRVD